MYHFCCPNVLDKYYCRVISSKKMTNLLGSGLSQDYFTQHKFFQGFEKKSLKKIAKIHTPPKTLHVRGDTESLTCLCSCNQSRVPFVVLPVHIEVRALC